MRVEEGVQVQLSVLMFSVGVLVVGGRDGVGWFGKGLTA